MLDQTTTEIDPVLLPYLQAASETESERLLALLIAEKVEPLVKNIIGYKLKVYFNDDHRGQLSDAEDIYGETVAQLIARLSEIKTNPDDKGIRNFRSYVAVTAYHACYENLRRKYPQRHSLKNKLRYFLRRKEGFALWKTEEGEWLAGFIGWENRSSNERRAQSIDARSFSPQTSMAEIVTAVLERMNRPVELDEMVGIIAFAWGVKEQAGEAVENLADRHAHQGKELDQRIYIERLWSEIVQLSPRHVAALLLNLKDEHGASAMDVFLLTGAASF
ncbi:MAG TPA: hypothetical protein VID27_12805, partial [Blastocatellia bacterium]